MRRKIAMLVAAIALTFGVFTVKPEPADAHIDWSTAFNVCQLINVAYFENPTGQNYNVYRASDFNFFGHFGVSCTIYPYTIGQPPTYQFVCYVYDRHTHEIFWIACPAP